MSETIEKDPLSPENEIPANELTAEPADKLAKLEEELSIEKDKHIRLIAEFENFKKRNARDRIELLNYASEEIILALLPVIDDFERALKAEPDNEGMKLIHQKLLSTLQQRGLKAMDSVNTDFNPDLHDALSQVDNGNEGSGKVIEEVEKGYYLYEKVIRHAKVIVGK
ncbi:MAG: nucleotide exchange factor GrpE [Bacteroidia bacterium]|nr:nucleotide exchange factor GrpE [Bacteroidia bacterium]